jgi:hypothetical protein
MKTLIAAVATVLFAANAAGHDVYRSLGMDNTDLFDEHAPAERTAGVQPSVGDSFDRYWGLADENPDLFGPVSAGATGSIDPQIYQGVRGNPDLSY